MGFPSWRWHFGLLAALPLAGAVAVGCALALWPSSGVTEANFEKLRDGMAPEQVDDILGWENLDGAPCTVSSQLSHNQVSHYRAQDVSDYQEEGGGVVISVEFVNSRLTEKRLRRVPQTLGDFLRGQLAKFRRRLGL